MRSWAFILLLFLAHASAAQQQWEAELMVGVSGYKGDLIKRHSAFRSMRPGVNFNLKYNIDNDFVIRGGVMWGKVVGNDKYNKQPDLKARNLNFQTNILELSLCVEYNLIEPEIFYGYPYIFAGAGLFRFDPYSYDNNNQKIYLRPLSTEGQGLGAYPNRKMYSKTQFCIPFGAGWKVNLSPRLDVIYEVGYRLLFTDYLDDVSTTYVDAQQLLAARGPKAVEMAYRAKSPFSQHEGAIRGNPKVNDWYFFNGVKMLVRFGKND